MAESRARAGAAASPDAPNLVVPIATACRWLRHSTAAGVGQAAEAYSGEPSASFVFMKYTAGVVAVLVVKVAGVGEALW